MVVKVFISSNQTEFSEERKFLYDELNKDSFFNETIKLYVFEEDKASSLPSDEVFINEIEQSDIYIGLIGQHYGNIYKDGISAQNMNIMYILPKNIMIISLFINVILEMKNHKHFLIESDH